MVAESIDFAGDDLKRKEQIAAVIADNFTKKEIRTAAEDGEGLRIEHGANVVGEPTADGATDYRKEVRETNIIKLNDSADATAITHEMIHVLRVTDNSRDDLAKDCYKRDSNGHVIKNSNESYLNTPRKFAEECAVTAEAEIRTKEPTSRPNLYYEYTEYGENKRRRDVIYSDERKNMRSKSTNSGGNGPTFNIMSDGTNLRGKPAIKMFERNFDKSELGNATVPNYQGGDSNKDVIRKAHKGENIIGDD